MSSGGNGRERSLAVLSNQPLIGVLLEEDGREVVHYFATEAEADAVLAHRRNRHPRRLAGVWSDLDWEEMAAELDRIRHASPPTPPISL
jgi:hypothetical protein